MEIKKIMRESTIGMLEKSTPPCAYDWYKKLGEAFKQGVEDGLKGENDMATMNTLPNNAIYSKPGIMDQNIKTAEDQSIHLIATHKVELDIQKNCLLEQRRFLKQAMLDYTDRGEFSVAGELSYRILNVDKFIKNVHKEIEQIKDEYGNDMRYLSRVEYLSDIHEDIERGLAKDLKAAKEESDPKPKKTKKSDGNAD